MSALDRSPELMNRDDTALLVVDVQEKLIPSISGHQTLVWNIRRLLDGAKILSVPILGTEQYPQGLGHTLPELQSRIDNKLPEKLAFSCGECGDLFTGLPEQNVHRILVCGIETHVCVQQTVLDLMAAGFYVYVAVDAVGSRFETDKEIALRRMESSGATLTTTEAALVERWVRALATGSHGSCTREEEETSACFCPFF